MTATATAHTAKRNPCGFCATGHHTLCPGSIRNGSAAAEPVWVCVCSENDHGLGAEHREVDVTRLAPAARDLAPIKARTRGVDAGKGDRFPEGVCPPVAFRHLIVKESLAPASFRPQTVYTWVKQAERQGTFPVRWFGPDGIQHDSPQADTKPGVLVDEAKRWCAAREAAASEQSA